MINAAFRETVGKNLIHYPALEPIGGSHILGVDCELEKLAVIDNAEARAAFLDIVTVVIEQEREVVIVQSDVLGNVLTAEHFEAVGGFAEVEMHKAFLIAGAI